MPQRLYCDNSVAVFLAKNNKSWSQSIHIDIKYLAIRERLKEHKVIIEHISIELMIVDPLTKGMHAHKNFQGSCNQYGTWVHFVISFSYIHIQFY